MIITIHRGTNEIGGCVTEYEYNGWHLFVDYGEELPGGPKTGDLQVEGLTHGDLSKSALLITHYHGDHIGSITKLPEALPIYMGEVAREIQLVLSNHLKTVFPAHKEMVKLLQKVQTFEPGKDFTFGPFNIKPVTVDHSAFDAYAFRIEADGVSAYHTGDFRLHGFRSSKFFKMLEQYVGKVNYVVCEATNILRPNATSKRESALQRDFESLFKEKKSTVVYLSSTNIDRLFSLYHAALRAGRPFYVDGYQKQMMDVVVNSNSLWTESPLYQYWKYEPEPLIDHKFNKNRFFVSESFKEHLYKKGYVLVARSSERFDDLLEQIPGNKQKVLSMWDGYVKEGSKAYKKNLANSLDGEYDYMHTSGHVDMKDLRKFFHLLQPKAIIPIHTDSPEQFAKLFRDEWPVIRLNDGQSISSTSISEADSYGTKI
jgi:ribonuclease J